jgi:homocysteine S-methyltransferase
MTSAYQNLISKYNNGIPIILDSGTSTELERRGVKMRDGQWSGCVSIDDYNTLVDTHLAYIDAGADVISINSFASSRLMLEPAGLGNQVQHINCENVRAAFEAREKSNASQVAIAGSLSHVMPFSAGVEGSRDSSTHSYEQLYDCFKEMITIFEDQHLDLLMIEMASFPERMHPMLEAASSSKLPVWCGMSAKRNSQGQLESWHVPGVPFENIVADVSSYNFEGMGIMHTAVDCISDALDVINEYHQGITMAYPDSGYFKAPNWQFEEIISPEDLLEFAKGWVLQGCNVYGGCCGLGPEHTKSLINIRK